MHSTTIGDITKSVLSERELRLMWLGLKSLKEFGQPPKCVGLYNDEEVEALLDNVTKAFIQHFDTRGPLSDTVIAERIENQKFLAHLRRLKAESERLIEIERQESEAAEKRGARLEEEARKRRTYNYGGS